MIPMPDIRFITLNPGHFHAALVQKEMYEEVAPQVHVYAPLGPDLLAHLGRIAGFNARSQHPTSWELEVHASDNALQRLQREKPGNVVVLAGRNAGKIDAILASLEAGMNVLADKPWVLTPGDLPKLAQALDTAAKHRLIAYDIMTERYEITSLLQKELVQDEATFGTIIPGSPEARRRSRACSWRACIISRSWSRGCRCAGQPGSSTSISRARR
jgi:predicted dehydrogenase